MSETQPVIYTSDNLANVIYDRWMLHGQKQGYGVMGASEDDGDISDWKAFDISDTAKALKEMSEWLNAHPANKYNLFYTVGLFSEPERKAAYALVSKLAWFETDGDVKPEELKKYGLEPSFWLESSPGHYHNYYLLNESVSDVKPINEAIGTPFNSSHGKDLARYLRIPGTINHKTKYGPLGKPVGELTNSGLVYTVDQLIKGATLAAADPNNQKLRTKKKDIDPDDPALRKTIAELTRDAFLIYARSIAIGNTRHDLKMFNRLTSDFTDEGKKSDLLYSLEHYLAKYVDYEFACTLIWNCVHNKFKTRKDGFYRVRFETKKAFQQEDAFDDEEYTEESDLVLIDMKNEIFEVSPEKVYTVYGILKEHDFTIFCGLPESFKTWFSYAIAGHVTLGFPLGNLPCSIPNSDEIVQGRPVKRGPCVIIESDTGSIDTNVRFQKYLRGLGITNKDMIPNEMLIRLKASNVDLTNKKFRDDLTKALKTILASGKGEVLVIFDNLRSLSGDVDENSVKEMKPTLTYAHDLAKHEGFTTLALHHTTKDGKNYAGTGLIKSMCDCMFMFDVNEQTNVVIANASKKVKGKDRFNCTRPFAFKFEDTSCVSGPGIKLVEVAISNEMKLKSNAGDNIEKIHASPEEIEPMINGFLSEQLDNYAEGKIQLNNDVREKFKHLFKDDVDAAIRKMIRENKFKVTKISGGEKYSYPKLKIKDNL